MDEDDDARISDVKPTRFQWLLAQLEQEDADALRLCHETYPLSNDVDFGWSLDSAVDEAPAVGKYIQGGFLWEATIQGPDFWQGVYVRYIVAA